LDTFIVFNYITPCKVVSMKYLFNIILSFCCYLTLLGSLTSCDKEPEVITITETKTDTLIVIDTITLIDTIFESLPDTTTTFILVRHAETTGAGSNPNLSVDGQSRANRLSQMLEKVNLNAIYSTNFNRTMQTAQPAATAKGISITTYDPFAPAALVDQVLLSFPKGAVLVVGHSNTIPDMLNAMIGANQFQDLTENEYDNLFVVHVSALGEATVTHLKY
jgi:2,3-bisphosphoglycerate-dependent phosphoglycerate mutase